MLWAVIPELFTGLGRGGGSRLGGCRAAWALRQEKGGAGLSSQGSASLGRGPLLCLGVFRFSHSLVSVHWSHPALVLWKKNLSKDTDVRCPKGRERLQEGKPFPSTALREKMRLRARCEKRCWPWETTVAWVSHGSVSSLLLLVLIFFNR